MKPLSIPPIPEETKRVAEAAFAKGNVYVQMRDALGAIYSDDLFTELYAQEGQPAFSPWRLALVTVMQFAENMSDRQAAEAVRARLDWKYALSLELSDTGFHYSVLSEFRSRLVSSGSGLLLLDTLLHQLREKGLLKARGQQRTDSTAIVGAVRELHQLELVGETLRHALNVLASVVPDWLLLQVQAEWFERYGERVEEYRLPASKGERHVLSQQIGQDGYQLLSRIYAETTMPWLAHLPAVELLRRVWVQQYWLDEEVVKRRTPENMPLTGHWIRSPYDPDVRYGRKQGWSWIGYKVHVTEACDLDTPHFITQVETVPAIQQDHHALTVIQDALAAKQLLPTQQLMDAGYVSAKRILHSHDQHQVELVGPVHNDPSWQAKTEGAYDVSAFQIDWQAQTVTCTQGQRSTAWNLGQDAKGESIVQVLFAKSTCDACSARARCTTARKTGRSMSLRYPPERHAMVQNRRQAQQTAAFKALYRRRAGVEGTFSRLIRNCGLRQARYVGLQKTHLQNLASAAATNILRLVNWLNDIPFAKTRTSRFAAA
jgi:transposase